LAVRWPGQRLGQRSVHGAYCEGLSPAVRAEARTRQPAPSRRPRRNGADSKTVVGATPLPRVRIPPPPLVWLGRAKFAAAARSSTKGETSRNRCSGVNERQRTSTTASAAGISFPHLSPGRPREHWACGRATGLEIPAGTQELAHRTYGSTVLRHSALRMPLPTKAALTPGGGHTPGSRPDPQRTRCSRPHAGA
jgi:hypothetical protein